MNGTFKVVYNKARGALMVVNEITSCVQVKGTKTVIAAAIVAMMASAAGGAYAADPIVKVDNTPFTSIKDALNSGVDGKTITLLGDITNECGYTLGKQTASGFETTAKNVTIDLAGHSYVVTGAGAGSTGTEYQGFQLLKEAGAVTFKNGVISADSLAINKVFQNYSNLTLDSVKVDGSKLNIKASSAYTLSNNHGDVLIRNSQIIAKNGGYAFDVCYWPENGYVDGVSVTVENSKIDGKIQVEGYKKTTNNIGKKHNLEIVGGELLANKSTNGGKIETYGYTTIKSTKLSGNSATTNGGAIYNKGSQTLAGSLTVDGVTFENNTASRSGGAIYSSSGTVVANGSLKFINNKSLGTATTGGGAIASIGKTGSLTINGKTNFTNNFANSRGGAIYADQQSVTINGVATFKGNSVSGDYGSAIAVYSSGKSGSGDGSLTINGSATFESNIGTALFVSGSRTKLTLNASDADDKIVFVNNVANNSKNGSDLFLSTASSGQMAELTGLGEINFGGSISAPKYAEMTSSAAKVYIADASRFKGTFNLIGGETVIGRYFDISEGKPISISGGTLDIQAVALEDTTLSTTKISDAGALKAKVSQFLTGQLGDDGLGKDIGELNLHGLTATGGNLILASNGLYNLDYLSAASTLLKENNISAQLVMLGELVTPKEETKTSVEDLGSVGDTILSQVTADANDKNLVIGSDKNESTDTETYRTESLGVSALDMGKATDVKVMNDKTLTLVGAGADQELVSAENTPTITLQNGNLDIGGDENGTKGGKLSADVTVGVGSSMTVRGNAEFEVSLIKLSDPSAKAELKDKAAVEIGTADVAAGQLAVSNASASLKTVTLGDGGNLDVKSLATATVEKVSGTGAISIGDAQSAGHLTLHDASEHTGLIYIDPAWSSDDSLNKVGNASSLEIFTKTSSTIASQIIVGTNSIVALGGSKAEAVEAFETLSKVQGITWRDAGSALFIGSPVTVTGGILVNEGAVRTDAVTANTVKVDKGMLLVNQAAVGSEPVITGKAVFTANSTLGLTNVTNGEFTLASGGFTVEDGAKVLTDNPFMKGELTNAATGAVTVSVEAENGVGALASAGIQSMTRRADFMLAQTIADRTSIDQQFGQGLNLWVDVVGERYEADSLGNGGSFRADAGYSAFGADFAVTPDIAVGAALQYGTASLRSDVSHIKNDIDNYGFTAYGSMAFGDARIVADLAYVMSENDITSSQTALNQTVDADMYSLGVTAQYKLTAGSFQFVPSVGIRVSRLETDAMQVGAVTVDKQKQTFVQMPIALRINGNEMNAGGWKVAPSFKVAYVPTFGDKDIDVLGVHEDVIDAGPVQGEFGLRAANGNLMFNANMMMGGGKDGTSSIGGKVGVKYVF